MKGEFLPKKNEPSRMPLSVIDLYTKVLPKTNCGDCGFPTCLAFAGKVVSEKYPLSNCPHIEPNVLREAEAILEEQYAAGKWLKKDPAQDALDWAKERAASMALGDIASRIGGTIKGQGSEMYMELPYFAGHVVVTGDGIRRSDGKPLNRWEQVFLYNHMAQGGSSEPVGKWRALEELPNTVSKIKSMREHVELPLLECFRDNLDGIKESLKRIGGEVVEGGNLSSDLGFLIRPLPKVPVMVLFWKGDEGEGLEPRVKLLFDQTIQEHLDIESILFLSERIKDLLCGKQD